MILLHSDKEPETKLVDGNEPVNKDELQTVIDAITEIGNKTSPVKKDNTLLWVCVIILLTLVLIYILRKLNSAKNGTVNQ